MNKQNISNGWVKIFRSIQDKSYYQKSEFVHLWVHILLKANHKEKEFWFNGGPMLCPRGSFVTGRKQLALETGINEHKVERILKVFESAQQIAQQKSNKNRVIKVLEYSSYQDDAQQNAQQMHNKCTTSAQQVSTNKNVKNNKNVKKKDSLKIKFPDEVDFILKEIKSYFPENIWPKNLDGWKKCLDDLMRLDKRNEFEIINVIKWARKDNFWSTNFLSVLKLRTTQQKTKVKYFDVFDNKMKSDGKNRVNSHTSNSIKKGKDEFGFN